MARKKTRHVRYIFFVVCALLACGGLAANLILQPFAGLQTNVSYSLSRSPRTISIDWPSYGESAIGASGFGILATHGPQKPLPTASVIKVLTALAVLKQKPLGDSKTGPLITITQEDVQSYHDYVAQNGSVVGVAVGEELTESQALEALLLPSANNIADTLARWAFGSIDAYLTFANAYAEELGMHDTVVTDPSGLLDSTVSTPSDLIRLGEAALQEPLVARIVNQMSAAIPVQGAVYNVNNMLGQEGIVGIKTGNNDGNKGCFLVAAKQIIGIHIVTAIGVIMDGPDLQTALDDSLPLVQSMKDDFTSVKIASAGQHFGEITSPWNTVAPVIAKDDLSVVFWNDAEVQGMFVPTQLRMPLKAGTNIGNIVIRDSRRSQTLSIPLQNSAAIKAPSIWQRLVR